MKESLSDLLVQLAYLRALTLDPKNMSDREADWCVKMYQAIESKDKASSNDDLSTLDDDALLDMINGNLDKRNHK